MNIVWILIFNCTVVPTELSSKLETASGTNLAFSIDKPYKSEESCLKDAAKGAKRVQSSAGCYFVCNKGYNGNKK